MSSAKIGILIKINVTVNSVIDSESKIINICSFVLNGISNGMFNL